MVFSKEERARRALRALKTIFFLIAMLISLLLFSAPVILAVADAFVPSALLSTSPSPLSVQTLASHLIHYDFRCSLVDIPLISIVRSAVILCVYSLCDGPRLSRGPYLWIATICSVSSLVFVSVKAAFIFGHSSDGAGGRATEVALVVCSLAFAIGHVAVAYRTSCRERRKLLVYRIDIEAVAACKNGFPRYQKIILQERCR